MSNQTCTQATAQHPEAYDYEHQAWVVDGKYVTCGHPDGMDCQCYGKVHAGEIATTEAHCTVCGTQVPSEG